MPTTDIHVTLEIKLIHSFCVKTWTSFYTNADSQAEFNIPPIVELNTKPALPAVDCGHDCPLVNVKTATAGPLVNCKRSTKPKLTAKR
uniref:Uncharacterized protein n=1 Tax=Romanomermis culicivorax TaxID=13658 RepID=A0A915K985_ROMCU